MKLSDVNKRLLNDLIAAKKHLSTMEKMNQIL